MVLVTPPFDGRNFGEWRRSVRIALSAKNKIGFVNGEISKPSATSPKLRGWERCNDMVISWCPRTFFNGCWHWLAVQPDGTCSVLCFDFSDDSFKLMDAPGGGDYYHYLDDKGTDAYVEGGGILVLNDHLSAICFSTRFSTTCCDIEVWMMMEYGVAESWTEIYAIQPDLLAHNFSRIVGLFFSSPNEILEILFEDDKKRLICCHDIGSYGVGSIDDISEFICWNTVGISSYMETLEPL